jgi:cation transport regulator ChaC
MNLVVYGSLINKNELLKEGISLIDVEEVKVYGFKRVFTQEPSYRFVNSINRAVLNIKEDEDAWFNAIVIKNLSAEYLSNLDKREKGYNSINLNKKQVLSYQDIYISNCIVYKGKAQKHSDEILPNFDYLKICLEGVEGFGKEFLNDFFKSTYKNSKDGLTLI